MPESVNGGNSDPGKPPNEMSMELRLLIAFILMGAVMFVTPYFFKTVTPPPAKNTAQTSAPGATGQTGMTGSEAPPAEPAETPAAATAPTTPPTSAQAMPPFIVDTDYYRVVFSNQGATVRSWQLKGKYKGNDDKPLELVNTAAGLDFPFSVYIPGQDALAKKLNWAWYAAKPDPDGMGVAFEFSDGHAAVRKTFQFAKHSYLVSVSTEVTRDGNPITHMIEWRGGFGDLTIANPAGAEKTLHFDVAQDKLREQTVRDAKNGPVTAAGAFSFAGIVDTYFAAVFLPEGGNAMQQVTFGDTVRTPLDEKTVPYAGVAVSSGPANHFQLFVGPKDVDLMKKVNPKLERVVDFGWISVMAKPLFLIVNWFNDSSIHNFGWSIVIVTVVINMLLFPLKFSNMKSMRKMQALKPQIDAINAKYKNLKLTDPKKGEQNQEVMDLYKKFGVNPMGGCFPMLIQIPFFFAFYKVFTVSVEMRGAPWLWVTDLSQPEHIVPPHPADRHDCQFFLHAEDDPPGQYRSQSAKNDDVHAADFRFHVL